MSDNKKNILENWNLISIIIGLVIGLLSFILIQSLKFGFAAFVIISIFLIINNPKRRFLKVFWVVFSAFLTLNRISFWIAGKIFGVDFKFESTSLELGVNITLLLLAAMALRLDYLENKKNVSVSKFYFNIISKINILSNINIFNISKYYKEQTEKRVQNKVESKIKKLSSLLYHNILNSSINFESDSEYDEQYTEIKEYLSKNILLIERHFAQNTSRFLGEDYKCFKKSVLDGNNNWFIET